ncbi:hypothetical protein [Roseateles sp.]
MVPLDEVDPPALAEGKAANQFYGKLMDGAVAADNYLERSATTIVSG